MTLGGDGPSQSSNRMGGLIGSATLALLLSISPAAARPSVDWAMITQPPNGERRNADHLPARFAEAANLDFGERAPPKYRGYKLIPREYYDRNGAKTVFFMMVGVDDLEAVYVFSTSGKIVNRQLYSYWDW